MKMMVSSCLLAPATNGGSQSTVNGKSSNGHLNSESLYGVTDYTTNGRSKNCIYSEKLEMGGRGVVVGSGIAKRVSHDDQTLSPPSSDSGTRIVRLRRIGNSPLGFSIRGGWEHGTGIYISEVHPGSEAHREGLKPGDQILRVNGFIIEQAIHEEVIALIKSSSRITLKVKSVGMIPIKSNRSEALSWKLVDQHQRNNTSSNNNNHNHDHHHHNHHNHHSQPLPPPPPPPCPIHSWSSSSKSPSSNRSSLSSSRSSNESERDIFTSYGMTNGDYMEARVFIRISKGQGLGCSVVKGPSSYPGIFVQTVKDGGIAQESGLEVGDQIIAMNGLSLEPGDIEFNEAIARIKSCSQMTLTVRKKSGLSLFQQQQSQNQHQHHHLPKQRVKAIVHTPPCSKINEEMIYHSPMSSEHCSESSSSSTSMSNPSRFYAPSEHDYSLSEVESNGNDVMVNLSKESVVVVKNGHDKEKATVDQRSNENHIVSAQKIYDQVRREEERLAEEKKKLESEQKRLQCELEKLEKERRQLETLKPQDDSKSISSSSTASGSGNQSISSSTGSSTQLGFLDEIKKLAEKRSSENGLITDTLNKTKHLEKLGTKAPKVLISGQDDENRKRHELLMEEFRAAHSKMFGQSDKKLREVKSNGLVEVVKKQSSQPQQQQLHQQPPDAKNHSQPVNREQMKPPVVASKSLPPPIQQTITNSNGETVTILRTTSPCKKSIPPPVPVKKTSPSSGPIVTITSYESNECKNRFMVSNDSLIKNSLTADSKNNEDKSQMQQNHHRSTVSTNNAVNANLVQNGNNQAIEQPINSIRPISIKINLQ